MTYFGVFYTAIMYYAWKGNICEIIFFSKFFAPIAPYQEPHIMTLLNYYSLMNGMEISQKYLRKISFQGSGTLFYTIIFIIKAPGAMELSL